MPYKDAPDRGRRRPLKIEPDADAENAFVQLVESVKRIEAGLQGIHELLEAATAVDGDRGRFRVEDVKP